jgi:hypothetical protein
MVPVALRMGRITDFASNLWIRIRIAMERFPVPPGHKVYQLDICAAIKDHMQCPGFTMLSAGGFELGPVACMCECHKKPAIEN